MVAVVKGKDGRETTLLPPAARIAALFCLSLVIVACLRWYATSHQQAPTGSIRRGGISIIDDEKDVITTIAAEKDDPIITIIDKLEDDRNNIIQFVFGNLDGEVGHEGKVIVRLHPEWAPIGVKRIKELTMDSFWDHCRAFRVLPNFVVQLGINGDEKERPRFEKYKRGPILDDPVKKSNERGTVTFAMSGPNTRTTQIFFNKIDNSRLDDEMFAPFGEVVAGMENIDRIYSGYGESPDQGRIDANQGNSYLDTNFPKLSYVKSTKLIHSSNQG